MTNNEIERLIALAKDNVELPTEIVSVQTAEIVTEPVTETNNEE